MRVSIIKSLLIISILSIGLAGCFGGTRVVTPTVDQNVMFTNVASTIIAQVTVDAALHPSPVPPTEKPQPVKSLPTLPRLQITMGAQNQPTMKALFTNTPTRRPVLDAGVVLETFPADGSTVTFGTFPDIVWTVQNTGKTTWNKNYYYRYYNGDDIARAKSYVLIRDVKPGEIVKLPLDANLPSGGGSFQTVWVLTNDMPWPDTANFITMTASFKVSPAAVVNPTAKPAATATYSGPDQPTSSAPCDSPDGSC